MLCELNGALYSESTTDSSRILFMREYSIICSAMTVEQLRLRLKENELEQYGESFTPDFVYDVMKRLPRFVTMQVSVEYDSQK
jgi:ubiquitin carboxyl-terminal hydrolase 10